MTYLQAGQMDKVAAILPKRIEEAVNGTPVSMLTKVVEPRNIEAFLCVELMKLKAMVNVDDRLNLQSHQMPLIAQTLINDFRNENLADFVICFQRGAMGRYDDLLLRLDGSVIMHWMAKYLDEKYQVIENNLMKEKEKPYEFVRNESNIDWLEKWKESVGYKEPDKLDIAAERERQLKDLQFDELKESYDKPESYKRNNELYEKQQLHIQWIRENFDIYGKKLPGYIEEEEWIKKQQQ